MREFQRREMESDRIIERDMTGMRLEPHPLQHIVTTSAEVGASPCSGGVRRSSSPAF